MMIENEFTREILLQYVSGTDDYTRDVINHENGITLKRFSAFNDTSAGGRVRLGFRVGINTHWISELTLTAQDTLYADDLTVKIPYNARLIIKILAATDLDIINIYLFGVVNE